MTGKQNLAQLAVYGAIVGLTVVGAIILGWQGSISEAAITAIFGAAIGFAGGSAASGSTLYSVVNGKSVVTPQLISEQAATNRTALVAAAASAPATVTPVEPVEHEAPE